MPTMTTAPLQIDDARDASGTAWQPDESVMNGPMRHGSTWMLMAHWNGFAQFISTTGDRGREQFGSINWAMGMASRNAGGGRLTFRAMLSAEPLTVGRCGYPDLLQSGEACLGRALHDQQHPHDLFMEVAADYKHALSSSLAVDVYGGLSGEPALGPVAFPHRASAMPNPIAPISHHWLDATHVSFGVTTVGVYGRAWKLEGSAFNGREPDDKRLGFDLAPLDSYSARLWVLPSDRWALQVSAGRLHDVEAGDDGHPESATRVTASATYQRRKYNRLWATTVAWGLNREHGPLSPALLLETAIDTSDENQWFGRAEVVNKSAHDLVTVAAGDPWWVGKIQAGYTRWLPTTRTRVGVGGSVEVGVVPEALAAAYGRRVPLGVSMFLTVRPR